MDVVTLGAALSIMKKMQDTAASSAAAAEDAADRAEAAAEQAEGAIEVDDTLSVEGRAADAKVVGDEIEAVKGDLNEIVTIHKPINLITYNYDKGYLDTGGVFVSTPSSSTQKTTAPIYLPAGEYTVDFVGVYNDNPIYYVRAIAVYDENDTCTRYYNSSDLKTFTILPTDSYVRINPNASVITTYLVFLTSAGESIVKKINNDVEINTDKTLTLPNKPADSEIVGKRFEGVISEKTGIVIDKSYDGWLNGYLDEKTGAFISATSVQHTTGFIEVPHPCAYGTICKFIYNGAELTTPRMIGIYKSDETFSRKATVSSAITEFTLGIDEKYIRINIASRPENTKEFKVFYLKEGKDGSEVALKKSVIIPQIKTSNYVHSRRPVIAFILDGDYDMNDDMEAVFFNHGVHAGFAIQYNTAFPNNKCSKYFEWQSKGHEILAHSSTSVSSSVANETVAEIVKNSFLILKGYGFNVHGFVAYQGNAGSYAILQSKKWFDYGCNVSNHSGDLSGLLAEPCLFFNENPPYELWRYSMQLSTLQQMKDAVDRCINNNGLLIFYGHANSSQLNNFTAENLDALLTYIESVGGTVKKPYDAISDYYSIRYDDISHG